MSGITDAVEGRDGVEIRHDGTLLGLWHRDTGQFVGMHPGLEGFVCRSLHAVVMRANEALVSLYFSVLGLPFGGQVS